MNKKIFILSSIFLFAQVIAETRPLTIINAMRDQLDLVFLNQNNKVFVRLTIRPGSMYVYDLEKGSPDHLEWQSYGKDENASMWALYKLNVRGKLPELSKGGSLVISRGGDYMFDDKSGRRNAVKYGKADSV